MRISKQFETAIIAATLCSMSAVAGAQASVAYKPQKVAPSPAAGSLFLYPERIALKDGGFVTA
jgi:hypothetical protein